MMICAILSAPGNRGGGLSPNGFGANVSQRIAHSVRTVNNHAGREDKNFLILDFSNLQLLKEFLNSE